MTSLFCWLHCTLCFSCSLVYPHKSCYLFFFLLVTSPSRFYRWAWCKDSGAGLESVWCDQSVPCSLSQVLLWWLTPLWRQKLHPCSCSQAALHHGGRLQGTHAQCVSLHIVFASSVNDVRYIQVYLLHKCSTITLSCWQETATWRQVHRLAVPPLSYFQAEVWQEVWAEIEEFHERPKAIKEIQWIICWVSLRTDTLIVLTLVATIVSFNVMCSRFKGEVHFFGQ